MAEEVRETIEINVVRKYASGESANARKIIAAFALDDDINPAAMLMHVVGEMREKAKKIAKENGKD